MSLEQKACDLFGGKQTLRQRLVDTIRSERLKSDISEQELYEFAGLDDGTYSPTIISDLENGRKLIDGELAMSVMAPLGISLDTIMPMPELSERQKEYWTIKYLASGDGPVHTTTITELLSAEDLERGLISEEEFGEILRDEYRKKQSQDLDDDIQLAIYIHLKALEELNTS